MILCFDSFFRLNAQFVFIAVILSPFYILSYFTLLLLYSALSVLPYLMCLFNVISVITTSSNHTRLVDFNASLLESPFALMKACCQLAETLVSFLLLQQLSEDLLKAQCLWMWLDQNYRALLHNHRMRNAHMCILAIVMATCSYRIYFWRTGGNRL